MRHEARKAVSSDAFGITPQRQLFRGILYTERENRSEPMEVIRQSLHAEYGGAFQDDGCLSPCADARYQAGNIGIVRNPAMYVYEHLHQNTSTFDESMIDESSSDSISL